MLATLALVDFETGSGYTTGSVEFTDNFADYFTRTDGSDIGNEAFSNIQGSFYFAAQDTNGEPQGGDNLTLDLAPIDISSVTGNLAFSVYIAEDQSSDGNEDWDANSSVRFTYSIDSGPFQNLIAVEAVGGTNTEPAIDTDFDGLGDGAAITDVFTQYSASIPQLGNSLVIRVFFDNLNDGDEDIAIDNLEVTGDTTGPVPSNLVINADSSAEQLEGNAGNTAFTFTVTRSGDTNGSTSVDWSVSGDVDAADFGGTLPSGTVNFLATETSQLITLNVSGDTLAELDEAFTVTLTNPSAGGVIGVASADGLILTDEFISETVPYSNDFEANEGLAGLGVGWTVFSVDADASSTWAPEPGGDINGRVAEVSSFNASAAGDDWLISPPFDLDATAAENLTFDTWTRFTDATTPAPQVRLRYSTDYSGLGDPTAATWTELSYTSPAEDSQTITPSGVIDLSAISGTAVWFAFQYTSSGTGNNEAPSWQVDNFLMEIPTASPNFDITSVDSEKLEGDAATTTDFTFTVTRSGNVSGPATVDYTVSGAAVDGADANDFGGTLPSGTVNFADGESFQTVTVSVTGDSDAESTEGFVVTLTNASSSGTIGTATANGTIFDDDSPLPNVWLNEIHYDNTDTDAGEFIEVAGEAGADLTNWSIVLYNGGGNPTGGQYNTVALSGVIDDEGGVGFGAVSFLIPGIQNGAPDGFALVNPLGGVVEFFSYEGSLTASDGPAIGLTSVDVGVEEGGGTPVGFSLQRNNSAPGVPGTWGGPFDDSPGDLNAAFPATLSIEATNAVLDEGDAGTTTFTFLVTRGGNLSGTTTVDYTVSASATGNPADAADFDGGVFPTNVTVTFNPNETTQAIQINVAGDTDVEPNESFVVTLSNPTGGILETATAIGTINDDDGSTTPASDILINEIMFEPTGSVSGNQYIELRGTPSAPIAAGTYLVFIDGDSEDNQGGIDQVFDLEGLQFGSNGFLVLLQSGNSYVVDSASSSFTASGPGWTGLADLNTPNIELGAVTALLITASTPPLLNDSVFEQTENELEGDAASWTILDGIGNIDGGANDTAYAPFNTTGNGGSVPSGSILVVLGSHHPDYFGRNGDTSGTTAADWVFGEVLGTSPNYTLATDPNFIEPDSAGGGQLNHLGATNTFNVAGPIVPAGDLVINEIMQNPSAVGDTSGEYFELWNTTGDAIDIEGLIISSLNDPGHTIANGGPLLVPANGFLVLGVNSDMATNGGITVDYQYTGINLGNGTDFLTISDSSSNVIDTVAYDDGATFPDPNGASMELIPGLADPATANDTGANWIVSNTAIGNGDFGTPGAVNSTPAPEINLLGNGTSIVSGDVTPDVADDTDFGSVEVGSAAVTRTFTIENLGTAPLDLTGVSSLVEISGSGDFTVSLQPAIDPIADGASTTFEVTFTPTTLGLQTATITIASDDADENPYTFDVQGTVAPPADTIAPTVVDVIAASGSWSAAFIDAVDGGGTGAGNALGYELTDGGNSLTIPWSNVNTIYVTFSEDVQNVTAADIQVLSGAANGALAVTSVAYNNATFTATVTLATPFGGDRIRLAVGNTVADVAGNLLDGDSDTTAGGVFDFLFDVLPGDITGDGNVTALDLGSLGAAFAEQVGSPGFQPRADLNSDGNVTALDLGVLGTRFATQIANIAPPPPTSLGSQSTSERLSATDDYFKELNLLELDAKL